MKQGDKKDQQPQPLDQPGKKLEGDIKASQGDEQKNDAQQEAIAEAEAEKAGKMTAAQARALLESLKDEDEHVSLLKHEDRKNRPFRDW
jgi:hypothetical protein